MLRRVEELNDYKLNARDGEIGKVKEFYFEDEHWSVRYLVADTGGWLSDRRVLISPQALSPVRWSDGVIPTNLTKQQIEASPSLDSDKPVSRQFEEAYHGYFGWPRYWQESEPLGLSPIFGISSSAAPEGDSRPLRIPIQTEWNPHLRSTKDVTGHHIEAQDGEIGHVEDFVIEDETWVIRYLLVATRNWWPGKKVALSPQWIERVSWSDAKVFVNLSRETIQQAPEFPADALVTRDYETRLHRHYHRQGYWAEVPLAQEHTY